MARSQKALKKKARNLVTKDCNVLVQRVLQYLLSSGKRMFLLGKHSLFKIANSQRCVCVCVKALRIERQLHTADETGSMSVRTVAQTSPCLDVWQYLELPAKATSMVSPFQRPNLRRTIQKQQSTANLAEFPNCTA